MRLVCKKGKTMDSLKSRKVGGNKGLLAGGLAGVGLAMTVMLVGCADHRICQRDFQRMQRVGMRAETAKPTTAPAAEAAMLDRELGPYRIGPGDIVQVTVTVPQEAAVSQVVPALLVRVKSDGTINMPLAGSIKVADLTLEDAEQAVLAAYVPKSYRQANVLIQVTQAAPTNVLVLGAVVNPGLVPLSRTERNLLFAMARAGGASQSASGAVTLRRIRQTDTVTLNLRDPEQLKAALAIEPLEQGDIVTVQAAKPNTVFVGGLVLASSPQSYAPGTEITLLQAVAAAGGLRTDVTPREATLIRRMDGKDVHVKLDLDRIATGKDDNITLAAGDILWVPHTFGTRVQEFINQNLKIGASAHASYGANYRDSGSALYGDEKGAQRAVIVP
jgi:protein involved in polysaccharide export with SLBB domain